MSAGCGSAGFGGGVVLPDGFLGLSVAEQVAVLRGLPAEVLASREVSALLAELDVVLRGNPLQGFVAHSEAQAEFLGADTPIVLALAGNRFGKTTSLAVRALTDCVDAGVLPGRLRALKRWTPGVDAPDGVFGRIVNPSLKLNESVILPAFQKWVPRDQLRGGSWGKAFDKQNSILRFKNGSFIEFMAYEQDIGKFGGAARHFVGYDEPPPRDIRAECMARLIDFGGYEMFAMTPIKANAAWVNREIVKKRDAPHITVVRGSIHDNPLLDAEAKRLLLEAVSPEERLAREFGDFVSMGGLAFPDVSRCEVEDLPPSRVREWDVVVGIDPGVRNCGITFNGFTHEGVMVAFDELLLQDSTPSEYVKAIDGTLGRWGLRRDGVEFVIDPAARQRGQVNAETVMSELARLEVYCTPGQNDHEAGVQQLRDRMRHGRYQVFRSCRGLIDELEDIALEDREDGVFKLVRGNDHRADTQRYVALHRPFFRVEEERAPGRNLGWRPNTAPPASRLVRAGSTGGPPMGPMS